LNEVGLGSRTLQPRRQLLAEGERVPLGKRALDILSVLAEAGGEIVTKDELLEAVWPGVIVEENALQVHIVALRKALGSDADRLKTIRGVGYQLELDNSAAEPSSIAAATAGAAPVALASRQAGARSTVSPSAGPAPRRAWAAVREAIGAHRLVTATAGLLVALAATWEILCAAVGWRRKQGFAV
jgi:DNA-binding winged helix-turn-helix (wHTH) protein